MKIKFKKLTYDACSPKRAHDTDAGFDIVGTSWEWDGANRCFVYRTGIAVEIPPGYFGAIFPRSSIFRTTLALSNCVGVIDSGFRGEIQFRFRIADAIRQSAPYQPGERIGQLVILPLPQVELVEVAELSPSPRGTGGFGSTGK